MPKVEPLNKSSKKVEFSNKVTEQIISDRHEGSDIAKTDPIVNVKEVDFDIKFLNKPNESSHESKKSTVAAQSPTKTSAKKSADKPTIKPTDKPADRPVAKSADKPTAKSTSKSPPPSKIKSLPGGKNSKSLAKEKSGASSKEASLDTTLVEGLTENVENNLPVEEAKVTVDVFSKVIETLIKIFLG